MFKGSHLGCKLHIQEPRFGYFLVRSAAMHSKISLARTPNLQFSLSKHRLQTCSVGPRKVPGSSTGVFCFELLRNALVSGYANEKKKSKSFKTSKSLIFSTFFVCTFQLPANEKTCFANDINSFYCKKSFFSPSC